MLYFAPEIYNRTSGKFGDEGPMEWMYKFQDKEVEVEDILTKRRTSLLSELMKRMKAEMELKPKHIRLYLVDIEN